MVQSPGLDSAGVDALAAGRAALETGDWPAAAASLEAAVAADAAPDALESLGTAYFWLDDPRTIEVRESAYRGYRQRGDRRDAARVAITLAYDLVTFRGEPAIGQGWLELAERQLDGVPLSPEHGLLAMWRADFALDAFGDTEEAVRQAARAREIGRELGQDDIELFGRAIEGNLLVTRGQVTEGMRLLTAAAAAAVSGDIADRALAGYACCYLINACDLVNDFDRAAQWCRQLDELCGRVGFHSLQQLCRAEYAGVLLEQGDWTRAEEHMVAAAEALGRARPAMAGEAWVRLAELRRRQGRHDEAVDILGRAAGHPRLPLVEGELALDAGEAADAAAAAERYLRGVRPQDLAWRAAGLDLLARAGVEAGDLDEAETALAELEQIAAHVGPGPLLAGARLARAELLLRRGDHVRARHCAEDAIDLYDRAGARYGAARGTQVLARLLAAAGDHESAAREAAAADRALRALRLPPGGPGDAPQPAGRPDSPLSPRELEVLHLVAEGLTNAEIAGRLVLSEHTVHRHVANAMGKLQVGSRAAAVARASALGVL
ncbi:LuxR C-terminal-related transcriptional regulator [Nocardioides sp. GCM10027113]|uniref:LuxR C-terminal-related transcriptional regulator n=1 Tax=unclassified Nocardioides TaxID=2615069 RepID=UPI00361659B7